MSRGNKGLLGDTVVQTSLHFPHLALFLLNPLTFYSQHQLWPSGDIQAAGIREGISLVYNSVSKAATQGKLVLRGLVGLKSNSVVKNAWKMSDSTGMAPDSAGMAPFYPRTSENLEYVNLGCDSPEGSGVCMFPKQIYPGNPLSRRQSFRFA